MCAQTKPIQHKPWGTVQWLPTLCEPRTDIVLDFIIGLPQSQKSDKSKSYNAILVIVDRFSKMTQSIPVRNTIDAAKVANVLVHKLILQGARVPSSIVSN
jgi:hypothetical protein